MNDTQGLAQAGPFLRRVLRNPHAKRGLAGAALGILMACVAEAWPEAPLPGHLYR